MIDSFVDLALLTCKEVSSESEDGGVSTWVSGKLGQDNGPSDSSGTDSDPESIDDRAVSPRLLGGLGKLKPWNIGVSSTVVSMSSEGNRAGMGNSSQPLSAEALRDQFVSWVEDD